MNHAKRSSAPALQVLAVPSVDLLVCLSTSPKVLAVELSPYVYVTIFTQYPCLCIVGAARLEPGQKFCSFHC